MKAQLNPSQQNFKGNVFVDRKNMTVFDINQLEQSGKQLVEYAKSQKPDYLISKSSHTKMEVTAKHKNNELKRDVFDYSVDKRENNINAILDTMKRLTKNII